MGTVDLQQVETGIDRAFRRIDMELNDVFDVVSCISLGTSVASEVGTGLADNPRYGRLPSLASASVSGANPSHGALVATLRPACLICKPGVAPIRLIKSVMRR